MKKIIVLLTIVLLVVSLGSAYAGNERRIGTAGAQELRIPVGARGSALGGAMIADVTGVESVYWNPAGLAALGATEAMFSHQPYIADIDINFVGAATWIEDFGTIAAAAKIVSIGDIEETTEAYPDGTGRIFSPTLSVLSLSYARQLTNKMKFGITGKFIHEDIFEVKATGLAFDIGVIYVPGWRGLQLGMVIKDYGPQMKFDGRGFDRELDNRPARPVSAGFDLPSSFNFGMSMDVVNIDKNVATVSGNFVSNNYSQDAWQGGLEYTFDGKYSIRGGYSYSDQEEYLYGFTAGAGLVYEMQGMKLGFDFSWSDTEVFDDNLYFTAKVQF